MPTGMTGDLHRKHILHRRGVNDSITPFCGIDRLLEIQPGPFLISLILQNPVRKRMNLMAMAMRKRGNGEDRPCPANITGCKEEFQTAVPIACSTRARSDCANKASSRGDGDGRESSTNAHSI